MRYVKETLRGSVHNEFECQECGTPVELGMSYVEIWVCPTDEDIWDAACSTACAKAMVAEAEHRHGPFNP